MQWPFDRECPFDAPFTSLRTSWERSARLIASLREELAAENLDNRIRTAYVCGSIGRMEAVASSDCDLVVVLKEDDRAEDTTIMGSVFDCVERIGCQRPKPRGIFGSPTSFEELLDPTTAGVVDEDLGVFGKRIQALLDAQPVIHIQEFGSLQRSILDRYASAPMADPRGSKLGWLMDDLIRYWRSLCARTRWLSHDDEPQWRALNVKLRHSRMLLCAGLFQLLTEAMGAEDPIQNVLDGLRSVPLERTTGLNGSSEQPTENHDEFRNEIFSRYEAFMDAMFGGLLDVVRNKDAFGRLIANGVAMSQTLGERFIERNGNRVATGLFGEMR